MGPRPRGCQYGVFGGKTGGKEIKREKKKTGGLCWHAEQVPVTVCECLNNGTQDNARFLAFRCWDIHTLSSSHLMISHDLRTTDKTSAFRTRSKKENHCNNEKQTKWFRYFKFHDWLRPIVRRNSSSDETNSASRSCNCSPQGHSWGLSTPFVRIVRRTSICWRKYHF